MKPPAVKPPVVKEPKRDGNGGVIVDNGNNTNIKPGKTPKYEDVVDTSFAKEALQELGEWKGPVCPSPAM